MSQHRDSAENDFVVHPISGDNTQLASTSSEGRSDFNLSLEGISSACKSPDDYKVYKMPDLPFDLIYSNYGDLWFNGDPQDGYEINDFPYKGNIIALESSHFIMLYNPSSNSHKLWTNGFSDFIHLELFPNLEFYPMISEEKKTTDDLNVSPSSSPSDVKIDHSDIVSNHYPMVASLYYFKPTKQLSVRSSAWLSYLKYNGIQYQNPTGTPINIIDLDSYRHYQFSSGLKCWTGYLEGTLVNSSPGFNKYEHGSVICTFSDEGITLTTGDYYVPGIVYQLDSASLLSLDDERRVEVRDYLMNPVEGKQAEFVYANGTKDVVTFSHYLLIPDSLSILRFLDDCKTGESYFESSDIPATIVLPKSKYKKSPVAVMPNMNSVSIQTDVSYERTSTGFVFKHLIGKEPVFTITKNGYITATQDDVKDGILEMMINGLLLTVKSPFHDNTLIVDGVDDYHLSIDFDTTTDLILPIGEYDIKAISSGVESLSVHLIATEGKQVLDLIFKDATV